MAARGSKGFSLVEVLIVLVLTAILSGLVLLIVQPAVDKAWAGRVTGDLRNLKSAAIIYNASSGAWPDSMRVLSDCLGSTDFNDKRPSYEIARKTTGEFVGFYVDLSDVTRGTRARLEPGRTGIPLYSDISLSSGYSGGMRAVYPVVTTQGTASAALSLFSANLSSLGQFVLLSGHGWSVVNGRLVSPGGSERRLAFGDTSWTDYTISLNAVLAGNNGYGIFYRADQEPGGYNSSRSGGITGYCFQFDPGYSASQGGAFLVRTFQDGTESPPIASILIRSVFPGGFDVNAPHQVGISLAGSRQTIKIDGTTVLELESLWRTSGSAGVRVWGASTATFSDIVVTRP